MDHDVDELPPDVSESAYRDGKIRLGLAVLGVVVVIILVVYWIAPI